MDYLCRLIAWLLPRRLIYWCLIRAFLSGKKRKYEETIISSVTGFELIKQWKEGKNQPFDFRKVTLIIRQPSSDETSNFRLEKIEGLFYLRAKKQRNSQ